MTMRTVRFRVRAGHLEPLEPVALTEGAELDVTLQLGEEEAVPTGRGKAPIAFRSWPMGVKQPLTRAEIYQDVG